MLRILHTSDWHLGHTLHDLPRVEEHEAFLSWLLEALVAEQADALLVAGDVFDTASPPAEAQAAWYRFLASARAGAPRLDIVVIGGNHDSAARLDAPRAILEPLGVRIFGGLPAEPSATVVPLHDRDGEVAAWALAVPFLRPADLPADGVRAVYAEAASAARAMQRSGQALVAMGHCYMTGVRPSELSERRILGGSLEALPVDVFPHDIAYVALGHLHLAQKVGETDCVRYAGSPMPLAMDEAGYPHQVCVVDIDRGALESVRSLRVPRAVEVLRVPPGDPRPVDEVIGLLADLAPLDPSLPDWKRPYLEVRVSLPGPEPTLRDKVGEALEGKAARLVRLRPSYTGTGQALGDVVSESLGDLVPEEVFRRCWARKHGVEPTEQIERAFAALAAIAQAGPA